MTRHLHIDLRPPVDYVLDATADESECTEDMLGAVAYYEGLARRVRLERLVRAFCLAVAVFAIVYFGGRELIGLVR